MTRTGRLAGTATLTARSNITERYDGAIASITEAHKLQRRGEILEDLTIGTAKRNDFCKEITSIVTNSDANRVSSADRQKLTKLLDDGNDVNVKCGDSGCTPLIFAVVNEKIALAQLLIDSGANVNEVGSNGITTALTAAMYLGNAEITDLLIKNKADTEIVSTSSYNSFFVACNAKYFNPKILKILFKNDADPFFRDNSGYNVFDHHAHQPHKAYGILSLFKDEQGNFDQESLAKLSVNSIEVFLYELYYDCINYQVQEDGSIIEPGFFDAPMSSLFCTSLESSSNDVPARDIAQLEVYLSGLEQSEPVQ